jgi:hypothetical protein
MATHTPFIRLNLSWVSEDFVPVSCNRIWWKWNAMQASRAGLQTRAVFTPVFGVFTLGAPHPCKRFTCVVCWRDHTEGEGPSRPAAHPDARHLSKTNLELSDQTSPAPQSDPVHVNQAVESCSNSTPTELQWKVVNSGVPLQLEISDMRLSQVWHGPVFYPGSGLPSRDVMATLIVSRMCGRKMIIKRVKSGELLRFKLWLTISGFVTRKKKKNFKGGGGEFFTSSHTSAATVMHGDT